MIEKETKKNTKIAVNNLLRIRLGIAILIGSLPNSCCCRLDFVALVAFYAKFNMTGEKNFNDYKVLFRN